MFTQARGRCECFIVKPTTVTEPKYGIIIWCNHTYFIYPNWLTRTFSIWSESIFFIYPLFDFTQCFPTSKLNSRRRIDSAFCFVSCKNLSAWEVTRKCPLYRATRLLFAKLKITIHSFAIWFKQTQILKFYFANDLTKD